MRRQRRQLIHRFSWLKKLLQQAMQFLLLGQGVSARCIETTKAQANSDWARLRAAWKDDKLLVWQRELVEKQLAAYCRSEAVECLKIW